jgi:LuxR family maltose regulon positive regulatory protein
VAADELDRGSLDKAEHYLSLASQMSESVRQDRAGRHQVTLAIVRLLLARQRGDLAAVVDESATLLSEPEALDQLRLAEDVRALAPVSLGVAEANLSGRVSRFADWRGRCVEGERRLQQGIAVAQRIDRPYLEVYGWAHWAEVAILLHPHAVAAERAARAVELARQHDRSEEPVVMIAYLTLAAVRMWQLRWDETEKWLAHAARTLRPELDPASGEALFLIRGELELLRDRYREATDALRSGGRFATVSLLTQCALLLTLLKMGEIEQVEQARAGYADNQANGESGQMRLPLAALRLAQGDPRGASDALQPVLQGAAFVRHYHWVMVALILEAIARGLARRDGQRWPCARARPRSCRARGSACAFPALPDAAAAGASSQTADRGTPLSSPPFSTEWRPRRAASDPRPSQKLGCWSP